MTGTKFDEYADSYEQAVRDSVGFAGQEPDFYAQLKARHLVDVVSRRLGDPGRLSALDVGCGIGLVDRFLTPAFESLSGADLAADAIARATASNPLADYRWYEGDRLPYSAGSFNVVFTMGVLHHVPPSDRTRFLDELRRVTKPGGAVVVFEHNPLNPLTRLAVARCAFDDDAVLVSPGELRSLLGACGLRPVESRYVIFFPLRAEPFRRAESLLGRVPLGAQHYVAAVNPASARSSASER